MTDQLNTARRDEVLFAFHRDCEYPSAKDIMEWTSRYPDLAEDIRAHAAILRDWNARPEASEQNEDQVLFARGRSHALNAIHKAKAAKAEQSVTTSRTFDQMLAARSLTIPKMAKEIDVPRVVLGELIAGRMALPAGGRLVGAFIRVLQTTWEEFQQAHQRALSAPTLGHAKARGSPAIHPRSYEEVIRSSGMTPEQQAYWLAEE